MSKAFLPSDHPNVDQPFDSTNAGHGLDVNLGAKPTSEKLAAKANDQSEQILHEAQRFTEVLDLKLADHSRHRDFIRTVQ